MIRRLTALSSNRAVPYALALAVALAGILALAPRPRHEVVWATATHVVLAGAPGLRWDDVSPIETPTLWSLAQRGSIGALAVRSARTPTCPVDGWLTLGAGNYARGADDITDGTCPLSYPTVERTETGAKLRTVEHASIVRVNRELREPVDLGALSESARCTSAVGPGAALAAARPFGRIDRYAADTENELAEILRSCRLSFVDLGTVHGTGTDRIVSARRADAVLSAVLAARPERSLVMVAGLADTDQAARLHVAIAEGPGFGPGWITSPSTGRDGYVRLIDLAPTALAAMGRPAPTDLFAGAPATPSQPAAPDAERPGSLEAAVDQLADADRLAGAGQLVSTVFFVVLAVAQLGLFVAVMPLLRRARRGAADPPAERRYRWAERALLAAALAVPAAMLSDIVPWWRTDLAGLVFGAIFLLVLAATTTVVTLSWPVRSASAPEATPSLSDAGARSARAAPGPSRQRLPSSLRTSVQTPPARDAGAPQSRRRGASARSLGWASRYRALGPIAGVAATVALAVALDVGTGARLQLNGITGYSALAGVRYSGIGTIGLGMFVGGVLLGAAGVAHRVSRQWRPVAVTAVGSVGIVVVGSPYLGSNAGGAVALTAGVCVAAAMAGGGWLSYRRLTWAVLAGLGLTAAFALVDLRRPAEQRSAVGRFFAHVGDGTAGLVISRTGESSLVTSLTSPLTVLVVGGAVYMFVVLLRPWGGLRRLYGLFPAVRGALAGVVVTSVLAGAIEGVGLNVAGAALAVVLPLTVLAVLRVQHHADDRTQPVRIDPAIPESAPVTTA
jgi:hypothetical protein